MARSTSLVGVVEREDEVIKEVLQLGLGVVQAAALLPRRRRNVDDLIVAQREGHDLAAALPACHEVVLEVHVIEAVVEEVVAFIALGVGTEAHLADDI
eukprot:CAMPEP_0198112888 /NCGR_PEP_ID=MMETSP1442-20131203/4662_1 /TAXON_ID= /ORGANISM="Craspedostauros australis, Strain CCMP3328" /LENGTH=97 /DNA_ID=CAMNT_0043769809 /DNA_START=264 /DNA_END=554 /DNA_ORIENTATION=-